MYFDALSFLEDERDAWRPFEALAGLTDDQLSRKLEAAHGWSGRDLIAHLVGCQEEALAVARELAVNERSPIKERADAEWEVRADEINAEMLATWAVLPMAEVRERLGTVPGELRGYLTVVPEIRWVKNASNLEFLQGETIDHYADHVDDLAAVLASAG